MSQYAYTVKTRLGKTEKGVLEAPSPDEAVSILQGRDLVVISISEHRAAPATLGVKQKFHTSVKIGDLIVFARSMATMTEAGLPLLRAMEVVGGQTRSRQLATALDQMVHDIRGGSTFRDALAKHPKIFSSFWISLVETGEASGQLTKSLEQIALHLEKSGAVQRKVVSALIYPAILLGVSAVAILVFTLKIIPTFANLFASFGAKLPTLTLMVISVSNFTRRFFLLMVAAAVAGWVLFQRYIQTKPGRWQFDRVKLQLPIFGPLFQALAAEEFSSNLGTLLKAGVPILHALEIVITTCGNKVIASVLENMRTGVREGRPLAEPLSRTDIFPAMVSQMIAVGEQTGKLASMLEEISKYYEEQVTTSVERLTGLLEPVMLVGMGLVIGTLVVSMYLPIFQISQAIKG
ncbi:MAG: type II secretion system F family protein [Candidatus Omnitrophica bacterium]|nr:type II secretion system F family protein [Candidatus Omnitrophota bacterium]